MTVLPCPGSNAWEAPSSIAKATARRPTLTVRSCRPTSASNRSLNRWNNDANGPPPCPRGLGSVDANRRGRRCIRAGCRSGLDVDGQGADVQRGAEQVDGIVVQPVGAADRGHRRVDELHPVTACVDLPPTDAIRLVVVVELEPHTRRDDGCPLESAFEPARRQAGLSRHDRERRVDDGECEGVATDGRLDRPDQFGAARSRVRGEFGRARRAVAVGVELALALRHRDLGEVDHRVVDDAVGPDRQVVRVVDAEVAERMRVSRSGGLQQEQSARRRCRHRDDARRQAARGPHPAPPISVSVWRAIGADSGSKYGLIVSAAVSSSCARCRSPSA